MLAAPFFSMYLIIFCSISLSSRQAAYLCIMAYWNYYISDIMKVYSGHYRGIFRMRKSRKVSGKSCADILYVRILYHKTITQAVYLLASIFACAVWSEAKFHSLGFDCDCLESIYGDFLCTHIGWWICESDSNVIFCAYVREKQFGFFFLLLLFFRQT